MSDLKTLAKTYGLDPADYGKKDDLCDAIINAAGSSKTPSKKPPKTPPKASKTPLKKTTPKASKTPLKKTTPKASKTTPKITPKASKTPLKKTTPKITPKATKASGSMSNKEIAQQLKFAAAAARRGTTTQDKFRASSLSKAAEIVAKFPTQITDPRKDLAGVPGIGAGTLERIVKIIESGTLEEISDEDKAMQDLMTIKGVGEAKAKKYLALGIHNVEDLAEAYNDGKVKLTNEEKIGVEYYEHLKLRIPRAEVKKAGEYVIDTANELNQGTTGEIAGSYRRELPTSGDIDILITNKDDEPVLADLVQYLVDQDFIQHVVALGAVIFHGTYFSDFPKNEGILRKIDINVAPFNEYGTWLLTKTGSDNFNIRMRNEAKEQNMKLSEHSLKDETTGKIIPTVSEKDVFDALGMDYVEPKDRSE